MVNSVSSSYIDSYKTQIKNKQVEQKTKVVEEQPQSKAIKKPYSKKNVRKRWGITAGITTALTTAGVLLAKNVPVIQKFAMGIAAGLGLGTGLHFIFTKKSKLQHDNVANNYGKRTLGITALGALTGLSLTIKNFAVSGLSKLKGRAVFAASGAILAAVSYSLLEGLKGIFDKSLKKEKKMEQAVQTGSQDALAAQKK